MSSLYWLHHHIDTQNKIPCFNWLFISQFYFYIKYNYYFLASKIESEQLQVEKRGLLPIKKIEVVYAFQKYVRRSAIPSNRIFKMQKNLENFHLKMFISGKWTFFQKKSIKSLLIANLVLHLKMFYAIW